MITSFADWLKANRGLQEKVTGDGRTYYQMAGDDARSTLDDTFAGQVRSNYDSLVNNGRYGTNLEGITPGFTGANGYNTANFETTFNGRPMLRTGSSAEDIASSNIYPLIQKLGFRPDMVQNDPSLGYMMDPTDYNNTIGKATQMSQTDSSGFNNLPYVMKLAGVAGGFGGLNALFPGMTAFEGMPYQSLLSSLAQNAASQAGGGLAGLSGLSGGQGAGMDLFDWITDVPGFDLAGLTGGLPGFDPGDFMGEFKTGLPPDMSGLPTGFQNAGASLSDWTRFLNGAKSLVGGGGGGLGGLFDGGVGDLLSLGARTAPGIAALAFAQNQPGTDISPLQNAYNNGNAPSYLSDVYNKYNNSGVGDQFDMSKFNSVYGNAAQLGRAFDTSGLSEVMTNAGGLGRGFDTSKFGDLSNQVNDLMNPYTGSVLQNYDLQTGSQRRNLLDSLSQRGVMGSSFGNMDVGNFETQNAAQRGQLAGQLGLQGIQAQQGLAKDILGAQTSQRGFEQAGLGLQGSMANSLLGAQNSARGYEAAGLQTQLQSANAQQQAEQARRQLMLQGLQQQGALSSNFYNTQAGLANNLTDANLQGQAIKAGLFGRAFDILGRAVSPSSSVYGR